MSSVLEALVKGMIEEKAEEAQATPEVQVAALREFFAARMTKHTFQPGQVLRHKTPDLATINDEKEPHMFLEYLEHQIRGMICCATSRT